MSKQQQQQYESNLWSKQDRCYQQSYDGQVIEKKRWVPGRRLNMIMTVNNSNKDKPSILFAKKL